MLNVGCIIAATILVVTAKDKCSGEIEFCKIPKINVHRDCPEYGFDCTSKTDILRFNLTTRRGHSVLTCKDDAVLFVGGSPQKELKCDDRRWTYGGRGRYETRTALCAKPCSTCSVEVPAFVTDPAISADVRGGNSSKSPCAIAFCAAPGLRLLGVSEANQNSAEIPERELRCNGGGWIDKSGNKYDYAICAYYSCPAPVLDQSIGQSFNVTVTHGAITCPPGTKTFVNDGSAVHFTLHPIVCDANNQWSLFGGEFAGQSPALQTACVAECTTCNATKVPRLCSKKDRYCERTVPDIMVTNGDSTAATCQTSLVCDDPDYAPVLKVTSGSNVTADAQCQGASYQVFEPTTDTVVAGSCIKYACKTDPISIPEINFLACPDRHLASCERARVDCSRVTCPRGWQLFYATTSSPTTVVETDYLTCAANGGTDFWDPKARKAVTITGASCLKYKSKCLKCRPPRNLYQLAPGIFEFPGNGDARPPTRGVTSGSPNCSQLTCTLANHPMYINDSPHLLASEITCGHDERWRTSDGTIVESAGCVLYRECATPPQMSESVPANADGSQVTCTSSGASVLNYQIGSEPSVVVGSTADTAIAYCGSFGRYVVNGTILPIDTAFGCRSQ